MTGEEMERAIEFLLDHHVIVSSDIEELKEAQKLTAANLASLAAQAEVDRRHAREMFTSLSGEMHQMFDSLTAEMRDGFNQLILTNEVTRDLASQVARLAIETSRRVTALEDRSK